MRLAPFARDVLDRFSEPLLARDGAAILLELAREPARVKMDRSLYAKAEGRLQSALVPVPEWLRARFEGLARVRLELVLATLAEHGFTTVTAAGIEQSESGRRFVALPALQRAAELLPGRAELVPGRGGLLQLGLESVETKHFGCRASSVVSPMRLAGDHGDPALRATDADRRALREAVAACFARLAPGRFYDVATFLETSAKGGGPLARGADPAFVQANLDYRSVAPVEHELASASKRLLDRVIWARLLLIGGIEVARLEATDAAPLAVSLTALGRYYLGLDSDPPGAPAAAAPERRAVVQPNFEVVLLEARPDAIADLQAFAVASVASDDDPARVFKITKDSVLAAARAGLDAKAILATLERLSGADAPDNVARSIREWAKGVRRIRVETARLVRCPDEETLSRILAIVGGERVPFALVCDDLSLAMRRKIEKLGFVVEESDADPDQRPAGYW